LWIHATVAESLNAKDAEEMRRGLHTGVFNSRGAHFVDPTGNSEDELAEEHEAKAEKTEAAGFHRLGTTMRSLAVRYAREAERLRKEHRLEAGTEPGDEAQQQHAPDEK
jgi:hypothetical protein